MTPSNMPDWWEDLMIVDDLMDEAERDLNRRFQLLLLGIIGLVILLWAMGGLG